MVRLATLVLVSLALACQCPPEVERFTANKCRGKPGKAIALYWDLGQEVYQHNLPGGLLEIEVIRSIADPIRNTVLVYARLRNDLDYEVRFPLTGVSLHHAGSASSPPVARDRDPRPNIGAHKEKLFKWEFSLDGEPRTGRFPLRIDDMYQWVDGQRGSSLAGPFEFPLHVGGTGTPLLDGSTGVRPARPVQVDEPDVDEPDPVPPEDDDDDRWDTDRPPR